MGTWPGASMRSGVCRGWSRGGRACRREGKPYGESDTYHQQQELFILVAARLAADQIFRAGVRRNRYRAGRCIGAGRNPAAVLVDPGAVPAARGRHGLGYAGDRRLSQRGDAECRSFAGRPDPAGPLPLDLRRNPFGLYHPARVAAGQSEGAFPRLQDLVARPGRHRSGLHHLARMPGDVRRPVPVRPALHGMPCSRRS